MNYIITEKGCWEWAGRKHKFGYGWIGNKLAHRISYALLKGRLPPDRDVCHRCDNPPCINPEHLFLGTAKDNIRDAAKKGRIGRHPNSLANIGKGRKKGFRSEKRLFTDAQVRTIRLRRERGESTPKLAAAFNTSQGTIWRLLAGVTYTTE